MAIARVSCASRGRGCLAGTGFAFISHVGGVQPCGYFDMTLGNVRETPFSRIWRESPVFADLRRPELLKGKCGACEYKAVCGGCRARALAVSGDYLAEEPNCAHVPDGVLLDALQTDFPICERPYGALGERLGLSEDECYRRVCALRERGVIRRIGAAFNSRTLGYVSTLVAFAVAEDSVDAAAEVVSASPFVTHNYRREGEFNLWFTLVAPSRAKIAVPPSGRPSISSYFVSRTRSIVPNVSRCWGPTLVIRPIVGCTKLTSSLMSPT